MDQALVPVSPSTLMPAMSVKQAVERFQSLATFVRELMKEGVDFGVVPGTEKPTLLKPGAEKLTTFFGLTKRFQIVERVEDWSGADHGGEMFFYYLYRCSLYHGDTLIAESDGSANSWESKFRYRWCQEDDVPPHLNKSTLKKRDGRIIEFKFSVDKAETGGKYGKAPEYWQRFKDAIIDGTARQTTKNTKDGRSYDAWEIGSTVFRIPNDDIASLINTIQKMSQKRALIAASLLAVNASEFFTQDIEDLAIEAEYQDVTPPATGQTNETSKAPKPEPKPEKREESSRQVGGKPGQILALADALQWDEAALTREISERFAMDTDGVQIILLLESLSGDQQNRLIQALKAELEARANTQKKQ
jgi:hypothetical protein